MSRYTLLILLLFCSAINSGCTDELADKMGLVTAKTVAGTYWGVLEGANVATRDDLCDEEKHIIVDLDLLHEVEIERTGLFDIAIYSRILPRINAIIMGVGPVALNVKFVDFDASRSSQDGLQLTSVEVLELIFVKYQGEWVFVLQFGKVGLVPDPDTTVNVYQYVSYPYEVAQQMSREEAIIYVNLILKLASQAQRMSDL